MFVGSVLYMSCTAAFKMSILKIEIFLNYKTKFYYQITFKVLN